MDENWSRKSRPLIRVAPNHGGIRASYECRHLCRSLFHRTPLPVEQSPCTPDEFSFLAMSKYTAFRCPEDLLELAKVKAKKDRRSLSNYIITLIEKDVQDMLPEDEALRNAKRR